MNYNQCRKWAERVGYKYLAFNGEVFSIDDTEMKNIICLDNELGETL